MGIDQLESEGVIQILRSDRRGDAAPVFAAVGPMQFEVASHRLAAEFKSPVKLDHLPYTAVRRLANPEQRPLVDTGTRSEALTRSDGAELALFRDETALRVMQRQHPDIQLETLLAEGD